MKGLFNQLKPGKSTVVDVRSAEEFVLGHVEGSINIPLHEVTFRIDEIKTLEVPIFLVCASGSRSNIAAAILQGLGVSCTNAGSWAAFAD